jgi:hypothetical protein
MTLTLREQLMLLGSLQRGWRRSIRPLERTRRLPLTWQQRRIPRPTGKPQRPQPTLAMQRNRLRRQMLRLPQET